MGNNFKKVDLTANGLLNSSNLGAIRETAGSNISTNSTTNSTTKTLYTFQSDTIGNITNVGGVVDLNWNGRRLESIIQGGTEVLSYEYNVDGQRVSKTFIDPETNTTYTTEYFYNGSILAGQKRGNDVLVFMYDNNGDVFGFTYNGTPYYYVKNAQNDVFLILDEDGMIQVLYQYDSWGKLTACYDGSGFGLAGINPIMYRSYYVDLEMGFYMYYLNSRYYMADWGRFISADSVTDAGAEELGYNLFVYAANNPVNNSDPSGNWIIKDAIKWVTKNVVKPVVDSIRNSLAKTSKTYSCGINLSGTPSTFSFNAQIGISADTSGNIAIQRGYSGGMTAGGPGISVSGYRMRTNAPSIAKLDGLGAQVGGTMSGSKISVGIDLNIIPDDIENRMYYGVTESIGIGIGATVAEMHVEWGETDTLEKTKFNVFDELDKVYIRIMEW